MATSGTAIFNLDFVDLIEEAYERCGQEVRSGYDLRTARRSLNLMFMDWASRGINLWTIEQGSIPLLDGIDTYALPLDTVDLFEQVVRQGTGATEFDIPITRISNANYAMLPTKTMPGRPSQVLVVRTATPQVKLWPVPDSDTLYTLVYWRLRRIQDAGNGANTMDVPFRFVPAVVAGLAYHLAMKVPSANAMLPMLKEQYNEAFMTAANEDREKATLRLVPRIGRV
jgi:hypothetical protein